MASYLDLKKISELSTSPIEKILNGQTLVAGKGAAIEMNTIDEILIADTLEIAEKKFKKGKHKLVIVGQSEPANSHPVVNFSNLGMPCLYMKNLEEVRHLVKEMTSTQHLAACVQTGTVSLWDTTKGTIKDYISEGFTVHPATIAISVPFEGSIIKQIGLNSAVPENVLHSLTALRTATVTKSALEYLHVLQKDPWVAGLPNKIQKLKEKTALQPFLAPMANPIIVAAELVHKHIQESFIEIESLLKTRKDPARLEFLLHDKILETFLFQNPSSEGAIGQISLLSLHESFAALDALFLYQSQLSHQAHFADLLMDGSQSPVKETFAEWTNFLLKLEPIAEKTFKGESTGLTIDHITSFKEVLQTLRKADIMPLFMTFFFKQSDNSVLLVQEIIALMPSNETPAIKQTLEMAKEVRQLRKDINLIGNPKTYPGMLERLKKTMSDFSPSKNEWLKKTQWETASPITRSISIQTLNELVDLYDTAIKTMKASPEINQDVGKTQKFKEMLFPYFALLKEWAVMTVGSGNYVLNSDWPLNTYLEKVESILQQLPDSDPRQQNPSRSFSVNAAVLGAGTAFERHFPQTLEDVFTLIHQNLLASTAILTHQLFSGNQIQNSLLPPTLKKALPDCVSAGINNNAQQIGIEVDNTGITIHYNVPLRNHSGKFSLRYDRLTGKLFMDAQFLGQSRDRWGECAERISVLNSVGIIPLKSKPKINPQELTFTWDISDPNHMQEAFKEYNKIANLSLLPMLGIGQNEANAFALELDKKNKLSETISLYAKETTKSAFGRTVINVAITNMANTFKDPQEFLQQLPLDANAFIHLVSQCNIILQYLKLVLSKSIASEDITNELSQIPENYHAIVKRILDLYKDEAIFKMLVKNLPFMDSEYIEILRNDTRFNEEVKFDIVSSMIERMRDQRINIASVIGMGLKITHLITKEVFNMLILAEEDFREEGITSSAYTGIVFCLFATANAEKYVPEILNLIFKLMRNSGITTYKYYLDTFESIIINNRDNTILKKFILTKPSNINSFYSWNDVLKRIINTRQGKDISEIIEAALSGLKDTQDWVQRGSIDLLKNLSQYDVIDDNILHEILGIEKIIKNLGGYSAKLVHSQWLVTLINILKYRKDKNNDEIKAKLLEWIENPYPWIEKNELQELINSLTKTVEEGYTHAIDVSIAVAKALMKKITKISLEINSLKLWKALIKYPEGKLAAEELVTQAEQSWWPSWLSSVSYQANIQELKQMLAEAVMK